MTEEEWLACADPTLLLKWLKGQASGRKLRLFGCACCRHIWDVLRQEPARNVVECSEAYADGFVSAAALNSVTARLADLLVVKGHRPFSPHQWEPLGESGVVVLVDALVDNVIEGAIDAEDLAVVAVRCAAVEPENTAEVVITVRACAASENREGPSPDSRAWEAAVASESTGQSSMLRDIFGNPFRPVTSDPAWRTPNVVAIAGKAYEERAFDLLPMIGDALEDAGCTDPDILNHCRGPGPHVRGCWVIDLLLGKE